MEALHRLPQTQGPAEQRSGSIQKRPAAQKDLQCSEEPTDKHYSKKRLSLVHGAKLCPWPSKRRAPAATITLPHTEHKMVIRF